MCRVTEAFLVSSTDGGLAQHLQESVYQTEGVKAETDLIDRVEVS